MVIDVSSGNEIREVWIRFQDFAESYFFVDLAGYHFVSKLSLP